MEPHALCQRRRAQLSPPSRRALRDRQAQPCVDRRVVRRRLEIARRAGAPTIEHDAHYAEQRPGSRGRPRRCDGPCRTHHAGRPIDARHTSSSLVLSFPAAAPPGPTRCLTPAPPAPSPTPPYAAVPAPCAAAMPTPAPGLAARTPHLAVPPAAPAAPAAPASPGGGPPPPTSPRRSRPPARPATPRSRSPPPAALPAARPRRSAPSLPPPPARLTRHLDAP